ncbi:MAG: FAD:protein FMN transferase [Bacteroidetes bacterium]|nr:FAD:protein FMN transferase [Bacteroidota bacterium]
MNLTSLTLFFPFLFFFSCLNPEKNLIYISGEAQGTTYSIKFISRNTSDYSGPVDSIFRIIDNSLSTYKENSIISRVNNNDTTVILDEHFIAVFKRGIEISELTGGLFDPTVMPLFLLWKFDKDNEALFSVPGSALIDSVLAFTGYKKIHISNNKIIKDDPRLKIDFSGIAQGYTVDLLARYLKSERITDYMIELGGEVGASGKNEKGEYWRIGIDDPIAEPGSRKIFTAISLSDKSLATSGVYRKYHEINGKRYSHIIDPKTGYGVYHNLLSASVIADDCTTADALATALIVMGEKGAEEFLRQSNHVQGLLIFTTTENQIKTFATESLKVWFVNSGK